MIDREKVTDVIMKIIDIERPVRELELSFTGDADFTFNCNLRKSLILNELMSLRGRLYKLLRDKAIE